MKRQDLDRWLIGLACAVCFIACTPVNSITRIKKTPDEYSRNYCCGEVSVPKSAEKSSPWIVYSDRDVNPTFHNPGGKVKLKEVAYLDPLAVIHEKGNYVEVVKYDASVFEGRKVKDPAKAEYLGWMPKSNLILSSRAMTDVATGLVMKMITMFKDTTPLTRTEEYFTNGSIILFSEPELLTPIATIPFQKPVYLAKRSFDKEKCLVIGKEDITPETASELVSGWIPSSMLLPLGEMLYADFSEIPVQNFTFVSRNGRYTPVPRSTMPRYLKSYSLPDFVGMNPVYSIDEDGDSYMTIKTTAPVSVVNNENNMVYSLSGSPISKRLYDEMVKSLKHINIMVVFSGQKATEAKFEQYVNYLQQLEGIVKAADKDFRFRLGYYVGFDGENNKLAQSKPKENVASVLSNLEKYSDVKSRKSKYPDDAWSALRNAMKLLVPYKDEQNIILLIGENGDQKEQIDDVLVNGLVEMNCRIIGCQLFSNTGNTFNNFVLQVEDLISRSADKLAQKKKRMLVHSEQLTSSNRYKEYSDNVYGLDFPKNSMQQGWVIFPKKQENLSPDLLLTVTDSTIKMIEYDTKDILSHIQTSFKESGIGRTSINPMWLSLGDVPTSYTVSTQLFQPLSSLNPVTNYTAYLKTDYKDLKKGRYTLFVSESELNRLREYYIDLLSVRVDYKVTNRESKREKSRSCPDMLASSEKMNSEVTNAYMNTSKARKSMYKTYIRWAQDEKVYPKKRKALKNMTLAENQKEVISYLSFDPLLSSTKLKAVKKKGKLKDSQLDALQEYILKKQKMIEESIVDENRYEFNGQVYFQIDSINLP